jgi:hypothetical protein
MKRQTVFTGSIFAIMACLALVPIAAQANAVAEAEPNNTIDSAQNIDQDFGIGANPDIQDAELYPWVSISATGDDTFDYYSFEVPAAGVTGVFDIDYGYFGDGSFDTKICLYSSDGTLLDSNDDSYESVGALGSKYDYDSYISYAFAAPGTYVIGVGTYAVDCNPGGLAGQAPEPGNTYVLQVSLSEHVAPVPPVPPPAPVADSDGDGVADASDCNPYSDLNPTVVFESCDSGVANTLYPDGCTLSDYLHACANQADNHGAFSSCVAALTNELKKSGEITDTGNVMIQSCAAQSSTAKYSQVNGPVKGGHSLHR